MSEQGHLHPITQVINDIARIFDGLGFEVVDGPEAETEAYNFDVLNIPKDHPARDLWDTFWLKDCKYAELLRTHTSPVQARFMEKNQPPFRIIVPGKTYRYEATDATHEAQFYQIEGLMIDRGVTLGTLKGVVDKAFDEFFGRDLQTRFRPSFFPFVEPGVEVDVSCFKCAGSGCSVCKNTGWIEVMGAGMVHPKVLLNVGINPAPPTGGWQGFAFGVGVDRLAMLKYGIPDVRLLYSGDLRVINQF